MFVKIEYTAAKLSQIKRLGNASNKSLPANRAIDALRNLQQENAPPKPNVQYNTA